MAQDWNIRPRAHQCQDCLRPFTEGELCYTALHVVVHLDGTATTERIDRCKGCWDVIDPASAISVWQSPFQAPDPPTPDPAPRQTVEALLRRLMESDEAEAHLPVIYVLAVMLERKKLLVERDSKRQDDGALLRVYEHRKTGEVLLITDPGLRLDQLTPVQEQVARLLADPDSSSTPPPENSPESVAVPVHDRTEPDTSDQHNPSTSSLPA